MPRSAGGSSANTAATHGRPAARVYQAFSAIGNGHAPGTVIGAAAAGFAGLAALTDLAAGFDAADVRRAAFFAGLRAGAFRAAGFFAFRPAFVTFLAATLRRGTALPATFFLFATVFFFADLDFLAMTVLL